MVSTHVPCFSPVSFHGDLRPIMPPTRCVFHASRLLSDTPNGTTDRFPFRKPHGRYTLCATRDRNLHLAGEDFLQQDNSNLEAFFHRYSSVLENTEAGKIRTFIEGGSIPPGSTSPAILVVLGTEAFVNQLFSRYPDATVEVVHFSLDVLAAVKEQHDEATCFYIDTTEITEVSGRFDAIFLNYFPIFSKSLPELLKDAVRRCNPGGAIVISSAQGKTYLASLKDQTCGHVQSFLPDRDDLVKIVTGLPLEIINFQDVPDLYLASLKFTGDHHGEDKVALERISYDGDVNRFPLYLKGSVIHGFGRGSKQLGYPTANISVETLSPSIKKLTKGVYYGCAQVIGADVDSGVYHMVMNIGNRPTFENDDTISLEVHILHDYDIDFYGKELRVAIVGFIREEMRFSSVDKLIERIKMDVEYMRTHFSAADFEFYIASSLFLS